MKQYPVTTFIIQYILSIFLPILSKNLQLHFFVYKFSNTDKYKLNEVKKRSVNAIKFM